MHPTWIHFLSNCKTFLFAQDFLAFWFVDFAYWWGPFLCFAYLRPRDLDFFLYDMIWYDMQILRCQSRTSPTQHEGEKTLTVNKETEKKLTNTVTRTIPTSQREYSSHSVNGDIAIQWELSNFDPSQNLNPLTDYDKTLHNWLRPWDEHVIQNLCQSAVRERLAKYVKYKASLFLFI